MADTLYTPDGRVHTLLSAHALADIIRDYAGDEAAEAVAQLLDRDAYQEARAHSDLEGYETELEALRDAVGDWVTELLDIQAQRAKLTKGAILCRLIALRTHMENTQ